MLLKIIKGKLPGYRSFAGLLFLLHLDLEFVCYDASLNAWDYFWRPSHAQLAPVPSLLLFLIQPHVYRFIDERKVGIVKKKNVALTPARTYLYRFPLVIWIHIVSVQFLQQRIRLVRRWNSLVILLPGHVIRVLFGQGIRLGRVRIDFDFHWLSVNLKRLIKKGFHLLVKEWLS